MKAIKRNVEAAVQALEERARGAAVDMWELAHDRATLHRLPGSERKCGREVLMEYANNACKPVKRAMHWVSQPCHLGNNARTSLLSVQL